MSKQKFYVVWKGRKTGIFNYWDDCNEQIKGFPGAVYKSFKSKPSAEVAFNSSSEDFIGHDIFESVLTAEQIKLIGQPIKESISVDAAWNTMTKVVEYKGVETLSGKILFKMGPLDDGTINLAEFLAIVHALAYCKQKNLNLPIYSDSRNAIGWVRDKAARTNHERSQKNIKLFDLVDRALKWLNENEYPNKILKWETTAWGENPADYGRK